MGRINARSVLLFIGVAAGYFLLARVGLSLALANTVVSPLWPATGAVIAAALLFGNRIVPAVIFGGFFANYISGLPLGTSLLVSIGNTVEPVSAYYLVRSFTKSIDFFDRPRDVLFFTFLVAPISAALSATVGATLLYANGFIQNVSYGYLWLTWWLGDLVGAIIVTPFILAWCREPFYSWSRMRWLEFLLLFVIAAAIGDLVFEPSWFSVEIPLIYLTIPVVVWTTYRFEQAGGTAACCLLSAMAIWNTKLGFGPFSHLSLNVALLSLQVFMSVITIMCLILAAVVKRNRLANLEIRQSEKIQAALFSISEKSTSVKELKDFYVALHAIIGELMYAKNFHISIYDETSQTIHVPYFVDEYETLLSSKYSEQLKKGLTGFVLRTGNPVLVTPEKLQELVRKKEVERIGVPAVDWLGVPLKTETKCFGVLAVQSYSDRVRFGNREKEILTFVSQHIATTIERKRSEEALRVSEEHLKQSQKLKAIGQLAGGVAHDFNNTLMAITSFCDILSLKMQHQGSMHQDVLQIQKAANHGAALTRQLLAFGRKQLLSPKVLDLNQVLSDMDVMLRRMIGEDIELSILPGAQLSPVKVDPQQFQTVIFNLAVNAREAMPDGGRLKIETSNVFIAAESNPYASEIDPGYYVLISITDTGCGMEPAISSQVFEPFFTTKEKGTGLGLATVYGIVKQSGGHVKVFSEKRKGSIFEIHLPAIEQLAEPLLVEVQQKAEYHSGNILLVDDNKSVLASIGGSLTMRGYTVRQAASGQQAIEIFQNGESIDLLVTDIVMPEMSGTELANRLLAKNPKLKILFISGYSEENTSLQANLGPAMAFLMKPVSIQTMVDQIQHLLKS